MKDTGKVVLVRCEKIKSKRRKTLILFKISNKTDQSDQYNKLNYSVLLFDQMDVEIRDFRLGQTLEVPEDLVLAVGPEGVLEHLLEHFQTVRIVGQPELAENETYSNCETPGERSQPDPPLATSGK